MDNQTHIALSTRILSSPRFIDLPPESVLAWLRGLIYAATHETEVSESGRVHIPRSAIYSLISDLPDLADIPLGVRDIWTPREDRNGFWSASGSQDA